MVFVGKGKSASPNIGAETKTSATRSPVKHAPMVVVKVGLPRRKPRPGLVRTSTPFASPTTHASHMVFVGPSNASKNLSVVEDDSDGEELSVALPAAGNSSGEVKIDEPKHVIMVKSNVSESEDPDKKGHTFFNQSITIVDKPPDVVTKGDLIRDLINGVPLLSISIIYGVLV